eukprot:1213201-Amorphochlora_amoeboformis.AAC.1
MARVRSTFRIRVRARVRTRLGLGLGLAFAGRSPGICRGSPGLLGDSGQSRQTHPYICYT